MSPLASRAKIHDNVPEVTAMLDRRTFMEQGVLSLAGLASTNALAFGSARQPEVDPLVTFAVLTDAHYADQPSRGSRHYRDSIAKMQATAQAVQKVKPDFAVELGDLIDTGTGDVTDDTVARDIKYLQTIESEFAKCAQERHYVLGNHCVDILTKEEFAANSNSKAKHYSFDKNGVHFIILDACFNKNGEPYGRRNFHWQDTNIPQAQLDWLREDLANSDEPTIVFTHQRLDPTDSHSVKNADKVREIFAGHPRVAAVLQGHSHQNAAVEVEGIHYVVARGMVEGEGLENNGYALVQVFEDGSVRIEGFEKQTNYELE